MDCIYKIFIFHVAHRRVLLERLRKQLVGLSILESKIEIVPMDENDIYMGNFRYDRCHRNLLTTLLNNIKEHTIKEDDFILCLSDDFIFTCPPTQFFHFIKQHHVKPTALVYLHNYDHFLLSASAFPSFLTKSHAEKKSMSTIDQTIGTSYYSVQLLLNNAYFCEFQENIMNFVSTDLLDKKISFRFWAHRNEAILFNTEQMTIKERLGHTVQNLLAYKQNPAMKCMDYSAQNIYLIKKQIPWITIHYLPNLYSPSYLYKPIHNEPIQMQKTVDVSFVGTMTSRRHLILQALKSKGISVKIIESFDMQTKLEEVLKSKILINIHAEETYRIFEFARCAIPIFNSQIILSEDSEIEEERGTNKELLKYVHFTSYASLVSRVQKMLKSIGSYSYSFDKEKFHLLAQEDRKRFHDSILS